MKQAVTYSVVSRKNPTKPEEGPKYYAQAQARGEADIRTLSERIQASCTVTRADVMAVLTALESTINSCLANGEIVRLGELGSLQVSISSKGADTSEEFNSSLIRGTHYLFRPGETLAATQAGMKFERVPKRPKRVKLPVDEEVPIPGGQDDPQLP